MKAEGRSYEIIVHRRIGGLERISSMGKSQRCVHRRIGGLEKKINMLEFATNVHRRIGGLEKPEG